MENVNIFRAKHFVKARSNNRELIYAWEKEFSGEPGYFSRFEPAKSNLAKVSN